MLPAIGQGVIALQCKKDDLKTLDILKNINDKVTYYCIRAERALLEAIGGDCDTAIGGLAELSNELHQRLKRLESQAYKEAESEFNLNSPKHLGAILFN